MAKMASDLGIGVSMLMMVKSGKRNLSAKALYRLEEAERIAGIKPPIPNIQEVDERKRTVTEADVDFYRSENARFILQELRESLQRTVATDDQQNLRDMVLKSLGTLDAAIRVLTPSISATRSPESGKELKSEKEEKEK